MIIKRELTNIKLEPVLTTVLLHLKELSFKSLIVGGSVRDAILGIEPKDIDIEVYGISYEKLKEVLQIYGSVNLVGKAFGVIKFNPVNVDNGTDYDFSIPRKENKVGVKHQDFEITFDENMTIEQAAARRDFTFNSIAYDPLTFEVYDYYGGLYDIDNKIMRHTSDKFSEDVLRILRGMQFQARFGFELHPDTAAIMREMVRSGEIEKLPKERVFEEWMKWAEKGTKHDLIFNFLRESSLINCYRELEALKETIQDHIYHPEGDVEIHTSLCLAHMDKVIERENIVGKEKVILVMSILLHDIAKPYVTEEKFKRGRMVITSEGHEELGGDMCLVILPELGFHEELVTPISRLVENHLAGVNIASIKKESSRHKSVKKLSRKLFPATIKQLLYVMESDTNGRGGSEHVVPIGAKELLEVAEEIHVVEKQYEYMLMGRHLIEAGLKPSEKFGTILKASYEAQENGEFSDVEGAKEWLKNNLAQLIK